MLAYDKLGSFLYEHLIKKDNSDWYSYAVYISYSHDGKEWADSVEVFELNTCDSTICWFNDWWEGEAFIKLIGIINIDYCFIEGDYHVLVREFNNG